MNNAKDGIPRGLLSTPRSSLVSAVVKLLDQHLRKRQGIIEYSNSPKCIFRFQLIKSHDGFVLDDGVFVKEGDRILDLHIWNEHVPIMDEGGPTIAFIRRLSGCIDASLAQLASYLSAREDLSDVKAIRGNLVFASKHRVSQLAKIASSYGFEHIPRETSPSLRERLHLFGENILISMLVMMRNPQSLRVDTLMRDRTRTFLSRYELLRRYPQAEEEIKP
jgi:hypothetical protein